MNSTIPIIRVGLTTIWANCTFDYPPCRNTRTIEVLEMFRFIISLLQPNGHSVANIRFVPFQNSSALINEVDKGDLADFTNFVFTITPESVSRYRHLGPLFPDTKLIAYKSLDISSPSLQIFSFFPWKTYIIVSVGFSVLWMARKLQFRYVQALIRRIEPITGLAVSIFLAYLSSQVVLLFNRSVNPVLPITDYESFVHQISEQRYRLFLGNQFRSNPYYGMLSWSKHKSVGLYRQVQRAFKKRPTEFYTLVPRVAAILANSKGSVKPAAILSETRAAIVRSLTCGLTFVNDPTTGAMYRTLFVSRKLSIRRLTEQNRALIQAEFLKIRQSKSRLHAMRPCGGHISTNTPYAFSM